MVVALLAVTAARREQARWSLRPPVHPTAVGPPRERRQPLARARVWTYTARAEAGDIVEFTRAALTADGWRALADDTFRRGGLEFRVTCRRVDGRTQVGLILTEAGSAAQVVGD